MKSIKTLGLFGSLICLSVSALAEPQDCDHFDESRICVVPTSAGKVSNNSAVFTAEPAGQNTERVANGAQSVEGECAAQPTAKLPFQISVDGVPLGEQGPADSVGSQRCSDIAAAKADVQIRYDSLEQTPWLNVGAVPVTVDRDRQVLFTSYSNYPAWIERAEIRVFSSGRGTQQTPDVVLPITLGTPRPWQVPATFEDGLRFVLRVYDAEGRFDETRPKDLSLTTMKLPKDPEAAQLAVYGEDSRLIGNIPVRGGAVTVNGRNIGPSQRVSVMGSWVPVDAQGRFATRQILPMGTHQVMVQLLEPNGRVAEFRRNISIADEDWFYIALGDLTIGSNSTHGPAQLVTNDDSEHFDNEVYVDGRLAFYLKGKIKGKYLLTAAADTREQPLDSLFSNFMDKDPRSLLRRLDPDRYYPVYGDDSTTVDDAPTQGKFYVRLERGRSHVMWGNFHTRITGTDLVQYNRGLYGAKLQWIDPAQTQYGESRTSVELFAADPGTLPGRDEFRGTGGSLYYLRRQDITQGSERAWIEVRDKDTGIVLETRYLAPQQDYEVNYIQGRIVLREPLSSVANGSGLIRNGSLSGNPAYLVATYEYTPGFSEIDDQVRGGRAEAWVNEHLRLGLSGYSQNATGMEQDLLGADVVVRYKPGTFLKIEAARSEGNGSGSSDSIDGGYNFNAANSTGGKANAGRIEGAIDFAELSADQVGRASFYWQEKQEGYSGPGQLTGGDDAEQRGVAVSWQVTEMSEVRVTFDDADTELSRYSAGEGDVRFTVSPNWVLSLGVKADSRDVKVASASDVLNEDGDRTDVQVRADYTPDPEPDAEGNVPDWSAYGYVQGTVERSGSRRDNDRVGIGGKRRINKRFTVRAETSTGDGGFGGLLGGDYQVDVQTNLYLNYALDTDRTDTGYRGRQGVLSAGARSRFSDSVSVFGEERLQHGDGPSGLTHAFGLDLAPDERWTYGLSAEAGEINDPLAGDLKRRALGVSLGYRHEDTRYAGNLEYRRERGSNGERDTWLWRNTLGYQVDPDWRFLGRLNMSFSDASDGNFFDGDFVEVVTGLAYRPVDNDRLNLLFKYTYYYDLPSAGQLDSTGSLADYSQRSHVLSVDGMYDLRPWLSVGGKYALRHGELRDNRIGDGPWYDSTAQLGILRADLHWVHEWDTLVEARVLDVDAAEDRRAGFLVAVYRHIDKNVKVGVGYNFTDFSDDLTDLSYDSRGWFINIIGKM